MHNKVLKIKKNVYIYGENKKKDDKRPQIGSL